jgi:hypothetical protein
MRFRTKVMAFQAAVLSGLLLVIGVSAFVALRYAIPEMRTRLEIKGFECLRHIVDRAQPALASGDTEDLAGLRTLCHYGEEPDPDLSYLAIFDAKGHLKIALGSIPDGIRGRPGDDLSKGLMAETVYRASGKLMHAGRQVGEAYVQTS